MQKKIFLKKVCTYKPGAPKPEEFLVIVVFSKSFGRFDCFVPQQPERLGVLPIKLRGGLGQPPETLHQVPRGSEGMEPFPKCEGSIHETLGSKRFRSQGSIHETLGSERFQSQGSIHETLGSERFGNEGSTHETLGSERFRSEGSIHETLGCERFRSEGSIHETLGSKFREVPK